MTLFYPDAIQRPLSNHSMPGAVADKNLIVMHITGGPTAMSAIWTFEGSKAPYRVSAHFVIDRDGTVYQLLPISDIGWHASQVNYRSVGIEHAAIPNDPNHGITAAQYNASAKLVKWLCGVLKLPLDRANVKGHNEASPRDRHTGCCEPTLSIDRVLFLARMAV